MAPYFTCSANLQGISRYSIALQHGSIIFGNDYDAGTWWNSDRDVLGFDHAWEFDQHPQALTDLRGLNRVKHIAVDERQARYFGYEAWYHGTIPDEMPRELRRPAAIAFTFRESYDSENYIMEFFPHFQLLTIIFLTISTSVSRGLVVHWKDIPEATIVLLGVVNNPLVQWLIERCDILREEAYDDIAGRRGRIKTNFVS